MYKGFSNEESLKRFIAVDELFIKYNKVHTIAVIADEIEKAEGLVEYINAHPHIDLQLHGWQHILYTENHNIADNHFKWGIEKLQNIFGKTPTVFYPPWNASDSFIEETANKHGMEVSFKHITLEAYIMGAKGDVINFHYLYDSPLIIEKALQL